ncbi:MAG TPA: hypothetical protein VMU87_01400 [Stellaceae bacterium]|nr:hypothetical protein [Stellaceae bacterium]
MNTQLERVARVAKLPAGALLLPTEIAKLADTFGALIRDHEARVDALERSRAARVLRSGEIDGVIL